MSLAFSVEHYLDAHRELSHRLDVPAMEAAIALIDATCRADKQIFTCGNGGSAAAASHYITDWNKMVHLATGRKFRGRSLCDNLGTLTAFANDIGYDAIFSGQLESILEPGDLLIAISGSGNSPNVLQAVAHANRAGAQTLAIVGYDGGKLLPLAHHHVRVPSFDMQLCEDFHLMFGHMVMKALCRDSIR